MEHNTKSKRVMPERVRLGQHASTTMSAPMMQWKDFKDGLVPSPKGLRNVMGYSLPPWQRGFVWTMEQKISFIESAWKGVPLGTFTYNIAAIGSPLDNLLIDGQQRMKAIQDYLNDEFDVFGYFWSEVTDVDKRIWQYSTGFASYRCETEDEEYLKGYYDLMNFGGTAHKPSERAVA